MYHIKGGLHFYHSPLVLRDRRDFLYVWEGTAIKFHGLAYSYFNSPSWLSWISQGGLMSLDVLLGEVHEKIEGICSIKGKTKGAYGRGVHSIWVVLLFQWVHQENRPHTRHSDLAWWTRWGQKRRGATPNKRKKAHDKE